MSAAGAARARARAAAAAQVVFDTAAQAGLGARRESPGPPRRLGAAAAAFCFDTLRTCLTCTSPAPPLTATVTLRHTTERNVVRPPVSVFAAEASAVIQQLPSLQDAAGAAFFEAAGGGSVAAGLEEMEEEQEAAGAHARAAANIQTGFSGRHWKALPV